jgi:plasmid stabilization system protein ParE
VRLRYTRTALADFDSILEYIANESPRGARRVHARIFAIIDLLARHPQIGTRTDDPSIRRMVVNPYPYLVFYEPTPGALIIRAVRYAARDPSSMPVRVG